MFMSYDINKKIQSILGVKADGLIGEDTIKAFFDFINYSLSERDLIKIIQNIVGVTDDGIWGPKTSQAVLDYIENIELVPKEENESNNENTTIVIDIGHADGTGAHGNGYEEHFLSTPVALELKSLLTNAGYVVHIIDYPTMDNDSEFVKVVDTANSLNADLFVSLHCDAADNSTARGGHTIYYSSSTNGAKFAECVSKYLVEYMPGRSKKVDTGSFYVLRKTNMPAIIIEQGFITNSEDVAKISDYKTMASVIFNGINEYASTN